MTNDNLYTPYRGPEWQIGKLSIGFQSHEDLLALAQSFIQTEPFLDAVGYILKRVDVVFGLRPASADGNLSFLDPPPHKDEVALITRTLVAVYLAWQIAGELNPAVASFKGEMLENLRNEIHRVNRDAIDAVRNGTELQKVQAAYDCRKDIDSAFYRLNRELGIHRAKYELPELIRKTHGKTKSLLTAAAPAAAPRGVSLRSIAEVCEPKDLVQQNKLLSKLRKTSSELPRVGYAERHKQTPLFTPDIAANYAHKKGLCDKPKDILSTLKQKLEDCGTD